MTNTLLGLAIIALMLGGARWLAVTGQTAQAVAASFYTGGAFVLTVLTMFPFAYVAWRIVTFKLKG